MPIIDNIMEKYEKEGCDYYLYIILKSDFPEEYKEKSLDLLLGLYKKEKNLTLLSSLLNEKIDEKFKEKIKETYNEVLEEIKNNIKSLNEEKAINLLFNKLPEELKKEVLEFVDKNIDKIIENLIKNKKEDLILALYNLDDLSKETKEKLKCSLLS
jgi:hypothetical protein